MSDDRTRWAAMVISDSPETCESILSGRPVLVANLKPHVLRWALRGGALPDRDLYLDVTRDMLDAIVEAEKASGRNGAVANPAAQRHDAAAAAAAADRPAEPAPDTGAHTWRPQDLLALGAEPPKPPNIGGILYSGKRHVVSGEDDAGKTMLLLAIAADEIAAGHGVVWIDTDGTGPSTILERLRGFGADDDTIRRLFAYMRPDEALSDAARDDLVALIRKRDVRLLVIDAFNSTLVLHGYNPKATEDVEAFWQRVAEPLTRAGAAVVLPDHLVKNKDERGRYAYGSERKNTGSDLHLGMRVVEPFGRGRSGRARLTVQRDRGGFFDKKSSHVFVLGSDAETGRLDWAIESGHERSDEGVFRPTGYMEKVSRHLEVVGEPQSRTAVETAVGGKREYVRQAIDRLVYEEYAEETPGGRNARLVTLLRPYREDDEREDS